MAITHEPYAAATRTRCSAAMTSHVAGRQATGMGYFEYTNKNVFYVPHAGDPRISDQQCVTGAFAILLPRNFNGSPAGEILPARPGDHVHARD